MTGRGRVIKPGWLEDEKLGAASDEARVLSIALVLLADDYGNGRAHPAYLASNVWTYSADASRSIPKVTRALNELAKCGFAALYQFGNERYYSIRNWTRHQKVDHPSKPRVPGPNRIVSPVSSRGSRETIGIPSEDFGNPRETLSLDLDQDQDQEGEGGEPKTAPPPNPNGSAQENLKLEPTQSTAVIVAHLPMTAHRTYPVLEADAEMLRGLYPAVDIGLELRRIAAWLEFNPERRNSTVKGVRRRIASWLKDEHERAIRAGRTGMSSAARVAGGGRPPASGVQPDSGRRLGHRPLASGGNQRLQTNPSQPAQNGHDANGGAPGQENTTISVPSHVSPPKTST